MGLPRYSDIIDENTDFLYNGDDARSFPLCCLCMSYSPFLFSVSSLDALESLQPFSFAPKLNIFCADCLPREPDRNALRPFYRDSCLFNSAEFISVFSQYKYDNPYYKLYRDVDRIIITEDTKISPNYKTLLRQPSPLPQKIRKLQQLFPPVHRMPFQKHTDIVAMFEALRRKELEIYQFYHDASTSTLHDNIDLLVDRTPLHLRQWPVPPIIGDKELRSIRAESESSAEVNSIVLSQGRFSDLQVDVSADSLSFVPETVPASTQQSTQQGISSQSSLLRSQVVSQTVHQDISSQSVSAAIDNPILSESYGYVVPALPAIEDFPHVSSTSSSGSEFLANRRTIVARRGGVVYHDSQEAGPSGIQMNQQQRRQNEPEAAEPAMKRRRASPLPMNPSPTDFHPRHAGTRTPRLHGG